MKKSKKQRNAIRKHTSNPQVTLILNREGYFYILEELRKKKNPAEIARKLGIGKNSMSKRIAILKKTGLIKELYRSTYKIYEVTLPDSRTIIKAPDGDFTNIHNIRAYYKIVSRGLNPEKTTKMNFNGKVKTITYKGYHLQIGKNKIAVIFKDKYGAYINNKFSGQESKNILTRIADDRITEFCNKYKWKVDFTERDVTTEAKIKIGGLEGIKGLYTDNFKMVYGDGSVEGDIMNISELLEGMRGLKELGEGGKRINDVSKIFEKQINIFTVEMKNVVKEMKKVTQGFKPRVPKGEPDYIG